MESQIQLLAEPPVGAEELNDLIVDSMQDIKAKRIVKLDLRHLKDTPADFFIVCEGDSTTQVRAIAGNVARRVKTEGHIRPAAREGEQVARQQRDREQRQNAAAAGFGIKAHRFRDWSRR